MKITGLRTVPLRLPLESPLGNATAVIHEFSCLAIFLETEDGVSGENLIFTIRAEQLPVLQAMVLALRDAVIGRSPDETSAFWADAWKRINFLGFTGVSIMGISAIDGAMWDLRGKAVGEPVARLIGLSRERVPAYASGGLWLNQSKAELVRQAECFARQGFRAVKLRLAGDAGVDIPRVKAVRDAIGDTASLMVDANQAMTATGAVDLASRLEEFGIEWFEEPLPAHNLDGLASLRKACKIPIASGENEYTRYGFRRMIEAHAADILMPDLQRAGGVSEFIRIAALAAAHDLPVSSHLFPELSLHLMAALPNATLLEHVDWFSPLYDEPMRFFDGSFQLSDRAGWGVSFDPAQLQRFRID